MTDTEIIKLVLESVSCYAAAVKTAWKRDETATVAHVEAGNTFLNLAIDALEKEKDD